MDSRLSQRDPKCVFCRIDAPVAETDLALAVFDNYPVTKHHALVIPKRHAETFFELTPDEKAGCMELVDVIKNRILSDDKTVSGFNVGFNAGRDAGQTVPHCHVHVIPRRRGDVADPTGGIRNIMPGKGRY